MAGRRGRVVCLALLVPATLYFCEFLLYYVVIGRCRWPEVAGPHLKAIFIGDPHLVGFTTGKWIDRLRREWQMRRSFAAAVQLLKPDAVFLLGDLFDEGKYCADDEWDATFARFRQIFWTPDKVALVPVLGNHDIGFHMAADVSDRDGMTAAKVQRWEAFFGRSVRHVRIEGVDFLAVNSMAMQDSCDICQAAWESLGNATASLEGSSKPVLLMHFPLYRGSEASCLLTDTNSPHVNFAGRDVVSHAQTQRLLGMVEPRFVFSAHMHHYCAVMHGAVPEVTVSTFNWRNRQDPSFVLAAITTGTDADTDGAAENAQDAMHTDPKGRLWFSRNGVHTVTCTIPHEAVVFTIYGVMGPLVALGLIAAVIADCCRGTSRAKQE